MNLKQKNNEREIMLEQVESELGVNTYDVEKEVTGYLINMKTSSVTSENQKERSGLLLFLIT